MKRHSWADMLDLEIDNETMARQIYQRLSKNFHHYTEIKSFFQQMEKDEIYHKEILAHIKRSLSDEQLLSQPGYDEWNSVESMHQLMESSMAAEISNLDDAFELIHELEASELNYQIIDVINRFVSNEAKRNAMVAKIVTHQEKTMLLSELTGEKNKRRLILPDTN